MIWLMPVLVLILIVLLLGNYLGNDRNKPPSTIDWNPYLIILKVWAVIAIIIDIWFTTIKLPEPYTYIGPDLAIILAGMSILFFLRRKPQ